MVTPFYRPPSIFEKDELLTEWMKVIQSGILSNGEYCKKLEEAVRKIHGADYAFACSSATVGMQILLTALKTKHIALPSFTWKSIDLITKEYQRLWLDIDRQSWLLEEPKWQSFDTIIVQHTFGNYSDPSDWKHNERYFIVYDAAYSMGMKFPIMDGAVISLSPTKTITSCEGGIILINDSPHLPEIIEEWRNTSSRLSELNAILALNYMKKLSNILTRKKQIFQHYNRELPFTHQKIVTNSTCGYYGILLPENFLRENLAKEYPVYMIRDIECRVRYAPLCPGLTNTDYVGKHILCLPCYVDLDDNYVVNQIVDWWEWENETNK